MYKKWHWVLLIVGIMAILAIGNVVYWFGTRANTQVAEKPVAYVMEEPVVIPPTTQPTAPVAPVSGDLYRSPVQTTDVFNEESAWMIAEPGVILDDTAAWVIPSVNATHFANVPEGGFTYFSLGQG